MKGYVCVYKINDCCYKILVSEKEKLKANFEYIKYNSPTNVEIFQVIFSENPIKLENVFKKRFFSKKIKEGFYNLNDEDLRYIDSHQENRVIELKNFFWNYISIKNLTIDSIKKVFINDHSSFSSKNNINQVVLKYIEDNLKNEVMTCTEIQEKINTDLDLDINTKTLGTILRINFTQKMKKFKGINKRVYYL